MRPEWFKSSSIDRLNATLWTAITTQYQRRGEDWLLKKGGSKDSFKAAIHSLEGFEKRSVESRNCGEEIMSEEQMLLLNLLGGRLPLGHQLSGFTSSEVHNEVSSRIDRILRRMRRVAQLLEQALNDA